MINPKRNAPRQEARQVNKHIQRLGYQPKATYQLDLDVFTMTDLRQRGSKEMVRTTHRYEFHMLVCVTQGDCTQVVDFTPLACAPGSLLVLRPGQAHNFGPDEDWDGWIVLFRSEFVLPVSTPARNVKLAVDQESLPAHALLGGKELRAVTSAIEQMRDDAQLAAPPADVNALLRHQLHGLLTRLSIFHDQQQVRAPANCAAVQRFKRFRQLVEERFAQWHQVADYASQLGYTEKTLARAVTASMGMTAKAFIAARIVLEAKRLLVHTDLSLARIGDKLGFDEPTNFSKFFKREAACTPIQFRRGQQPSDQRRR